MLLPSFHAMQHEGGGEELEGTAQGKALVAMISGLPAGVGIEHGAAELAPAFLLDFGKPVGDCIGPFGEKNSAGEKYARKNSAQARKQCCPAREE
jgi:hypothetical protein